MNANLVNQAAASDPSTQCAVQLQRQIGPPPIGLLCHELVLCYDPGFSKLLWWRHILGCSAGTRVVGCLWTIREVFEKRLSLIFKICLCIPYTKIKKNLEKNGKF